MDTAFKILNYIQDYIHSVPASSWYALGSFIGTSFIGVGIVAWVNRRHLKQTGEKLGRVFVALNVTFWSAIMTVVTFVLSAGPHFAAFLPFFGNHWMQIVGIMTLIYNVGKPSLEFWKAKRDGKQSFASTLPDLKPLVEQIGQPVSSNAGYPLSNGTVANEVPREKLLQL
jgi:uncharacterized membrane protein YbhN (UPF0104 family)